MLLRNAALSVIFATMFAMVAIIMKLSFLGSPLMTLAMDALPLLVSYEV